MPLLPFLREREIRKIKNVELENHNNTASDDEANVDSIKPSSLGINYALCLCGYIC
jgi:hypothetical protein